MKIATLGNCQLLSLSWYIRRLFENSGQHFECKWIGSPFAHLPFPYAARFEEPEQSILNKDSALDYIKDADYVICQPLKKDITFNFINLPKLIKKDCKLLFIGYFRHDLRFPIDFTIERLCHYFRHVRFSPTYISQKYSDETGFEKFKDGGLGSTNHPNAFYFLCLMREICDHFNWEYYSEKRVQELKEKGYPFETQKKQINYKGYYKI
jgi:hypothetical protein